MPASGVGTAEAARHPHELGTEGVRRGAPIAHAVAALAALDLHEQRVVGRQQEGALEVQVEAVCPWRWSPANSSRSNLNSGGRIFWKVALAII